MKITAQEEYSLRCLLRLAKLEREEPRYPVTLGAVAEAEGLSNPYVAKLLATLWRAGYVVSVRGRQGGYRLARAPSEIRLGQLLLALDEPLFDDPGYCNRHAGTETDGCCVHLDTCSLRALWQTLEQWMRQALDRLTLADLLRGEREITTLLRLRLAESAPGNSPTVVSLPVLSDDQVAAAAGTRDKPRKRAAKPT